MEPVADAQLSASAKLMMQFNELACYNACTCCSRNGIAMLLQVAIPNVLRLVWNGIRPSMVVMFALLWTLPGFAGTTSSTTCSALYSGKASSPTSCFVEQANTVSIGAAMATAEAQYGVLKTLTSATGSNAFPGSSANAKAQFEDYVTIQAAGLATGTAAYVKVGNQFDYVLSHNFTGQSAVGNRGSKAAQFILEMSSPLGSASARGLEESYFGPNPSQSRMDIASELTLKVALGRPFFIRGTLETWTALQGTGQAIADASHSAYWGGILSVTTEDGTPLAYTLSSVSGTDWSQSFASTVPEPGAQASMISGLVLLGWFFRRRPRSS